MKTGLNLNFSKKNILGIPEKFPFLKNENQNYNLQFKNNNKTKFEFSFETLNNKKIEDN